MATPALHPDRSRIFHHVLGRYRNPLLDTVHPRACGERVIILVGDGHAGGSSPRLRGTLPRHGAGIVQRRFIPAPAGNAAFAWRRRISASVHPRACGERVRSQQPTALIFGSSPRLRGTPGRGVPAKFGNRFIPAPAGNATCTTSPCSPPSVHPRACGERLAAFGREVAEVGSSPRLRGTLPAGDGRCRGDRFIPAPAGNASGPRASGAARAVHPRACGERLRGHALGHALRGSSPRLRGTRPGVGGQRGGRRFIPAPAGNALPGRHWNR